MKTIFLVVFVLGAALAVCESKKCRKQEDCASDECCSQLLRIADPTCTKLKQKGDPCLTEVTQEDGKYLFSCPCAEGLKCRPEKETDHNGVVNFLNDRCGN
ncbi:toxin CSTX-20-like [Argiope bruennichi]|uniref:toxin CSTX-20-like n=1 Tax=Argiope bruennichi TaxID=94029 RepID=UPI0024957181|nr:toxin CSTX-20-like [Argiope bruennichi]